MLSIGWDLVFTIINLIVLYLAMKKFLIGPVTAVMEKRKELIEGGLQDVRKKEAEAERLKAQYEEALGQAKEESRQLLEAARKTAKEEGERILQEANDRAKEALAKNQKALASQKEQMQKDAQSEIAKLAMLAAGKVLGSKIDVQGDWKLYDEFIEKAEEGYDTDGLSLR